MLDLLYLFLKEMVITILDDRSISGCVVKRATKRIHEAGGCNATDECSRGYNDAVTLALNILLGETGYVVEDILDYEEDKKDEICE